MPSSTTLDPSAESLAVRVGAWQQFSLNIGAILRLGYMAHVVTSGICRYIRAVTRFCPLRADGSALLVPRRFAYAFCHKPLHQHFERCHSAQVWLLPCRPMVWRIHGQAKLRRSYGRPRQDQGLQSDVVSRARAEWPLPLQLRRGSHHLQAFSAPARHSCCAQRRAPHRHAPRRLSLCALNLLLARLLHVPRPRLLANSLGSTSSLLLLARTSRLHLCVPPLRLRPVHVLRSRALRLKPARRILLTVVPLQCPFFGF